MSSSESDEGSLNEAAAPGLDLGQILIVVSVMLAVLLEIIDTSIVNVALPSMMGNLGASLDEADWVITGYIVSNVIIIPMTSWFAGRFGRKRYFVTSILIFTAASVLCGTSTRIEMLILWRIVQGLGGGALLATSQTILVETFPPSRQGMGQAIFGVGAMIGPSLGPTLGGWLTDTWSWHWIFLVNAPLGLAAAAMCAARLKDPPHARARKGIAVDWPGIVLLVVGIGSLQTLLERGNRADWFASLEIRVLAVAALVGLVGLVWRELTTATPIVDLRVLRHRSLAIGCVLGVLLGLTLYGSTFLFPLYSQTLLGWSAWDSGLAMLPSSIATAVMMSAMGALVWRLGPRHLFVTGMVIVTFALVGMSRWTLETGWDQILAPQILRGLGMGMMFVPLSTATLRALPLAEISKGAGLYNLFRQLGGSMGIAALTSILSHRVDIHRTALAEQLSPLSHASSQAFDQLSRGFAAHGMATEQAQATATALLGQMLERQALQEAFADAYSGIAVLFVLMIPVGFLLARHSPGKFPAPAATARSEPDGRSVPA